MLRMADRNRGRTEASSKSGIVSQRSPFLSSKYPSRESINVYLIILYTSLRTICKIVESILHSPFRESTYENILTIPSSMHCNSCVKEKVKVR